MKQILLLVAVGAFILSPIKPMAMLEVDENGKPIEKEVQPGEYTTMMAPNETVSSDGQIYPADRGETIDGNQGSEPAQVIDDLSKTTSTDENLLHKNTTVEEDGYRTVATEESSTELLANEEKNSSLSTIIISGGIGSLLGIIGTIFILSRRK